MALQPQGWQGYGSGMGRYLTGGRRESGSSIAAGFYADPFGRGVPDRDFGSTMPTRATLANALREGEYFTVAGQRFKWSNNDALLADAEGRTGAEMRAAASDALAAEFEEAEAELYAGYEDLETEAKGLLEGMGAGSEARIRRDWGEFGTKAATGAHQWATTHGLAGTTVLPTLQKGAAETTQRNIDIELGQLEEGLRREELGVLTGVRGARLGMQERRTPGFRFQADLAAQQGEWAGAGDRGIFAIAAAQRPRFAVGGGAGAGGGGGAAGGPFPARGRGGVPGGGKPAGAGGGFRQRPALPAEPLPNIPGQMSPAPSLWEPAQDPLLPYRKAAPGSEADTRGFSGAMAGYLPDLTEETRSQKRQRLSSTAKKKGAAGALQVYRTAAPSYNVAPQRRYS